MPELPEVETIARDLQKTILNKVIRCVDVHDPFVVKQSKTDFIKRLNKQGIDAITRRGKALAIHLSSGEFFIVQVMMTGQLVFNATPDRHTRVVFDFTDGSKLLYNDQRRFGHLQVVKNLEEVKHFQILGPEPFSKEFNDEYLCQQLKKSRRPIKTLLLDHTMVAGIGNIYACEILFRSKISPKKLSCRINRGQASQIRYQIIDVLKEAIAARGSSMRNYRDGAGNKGRFKSRIRVYAREGDACVACATPIERIVQGGRSTFYCVKCQK